MTEEESKNFQKFLLIVGAGLLTYLLWEKWGRAFFIGDDDGSGGAGGKGGDAIGDGSGDGTGGDGSGDGTGGDGSGAGGAGGEGGSGGGVGDYTTLAAAIYALAEGVKLPNIKSITKAAVVGTNEVVPYLSGQRICVLAYGVSGAGVITGKWRSGGQTVNLWEMDLNAPAGNSGANLATSWPGYLFATAAGDPLAFNTDGVCTVSVTYWQENA
jgi:hypothetical protein